MFAYIATALWVLCWLVSECVQLLGVVGCVRVVVSGCVQLMLTVDGNS